MNTCEYMGEEWVDGEKAYIIHVYEDLPDHIATFGWYAVGKEGKIVTDMINNIKLDYNDGRWGRNNA